MSSCPFRDMNESANPHSQQSDTRKQNQAPRVLTQKWVLNNENTWTQGGEHHTLGSVRGKGAWGGITFGEIPNVGDGGMEAVSHHGRYIPV